MIASVPKKACLDMSGIATTRHSAADGLCDRADVMGRSTTAEPDVSHVEGETFAREFRAFVAVASERIERGRKRAAARNAVTTSVGQRLERRLRLGGAIGDGKRRDMAGDRLADTSDDRHQRLRPALAIQADDISAGGL